MKSKMHLTIAKTQSTDINLINREQISRRHWRFVWDDHYDGKFDLVLFYTSTKSWRGYIFTAVCLCVCVCVWVCVFVCEQNSSRMDASLWTRFLLNGCLPHWLIPYWHWWSWVKDQGHFIFFIILCLHLKYEFIQI